MAQNPWELPEGFDEASQEALKIIYRALKESGKLIPAEAIDALKSGNIQNFSELIDWAGIKGMLEPLNELLTAQTKRSAIKLFRDGGVGSQLTFDLIDDRAVFAAQTQSSKLIVDITDQMRNTIQGIITRSVSGELTVMEAAREIQTFIPLLDRDAQAVRAYEQRQQNRFSKQGMSEAKAKEKAKAKAEKYADKLTRNRAKTIARTEVARAATDGRFVGWETGVETGMIDNQSMKEWIAEPDACDICAPMDGQLYKWDDNFPAGVMMPPAHPNCRCDAAILPPDYADSMFTAQAVQKSGANQFEVEFAKHLAGKHNQDTHGHGKTKLNLPDRKIATDVSGYNNVSDTFPHVGLSPKAQAIAAQIGPSYGEKIITTTGFTGQLDEAKQLQAVWTDKNGDRYTMTYHEEITEGKFNQHVNPDAHVFVQNTGTFTDAAGKVYPTNSQIFIIGGEASTEQQPYSVISGAESDVRGLGTALLEFARREYPYPILHNSDLTDEGKAFARTTKAIQKHMAGKHNQDSHAGGRGSGQPTIRLGGTFRTPEYGHFNDELGDKLTQASGASFPVPADPKISGGLVSATAPFVGLSSKAQAIAAKISPSSPAKIERNEKYGTETRTQTADYTAGSKTYELELQKIYGFRNGVTEPFSPRVIVYARAKGGSDRQNDGKIIIEPSDYQAIRYGYIERVNVFDKGAGLATAMLEFARRETEYPIFHSTELSAEGAQFAETTKSIAKHMAGKHDQSSHGKGGAGKALDVSRIDSASQHNLVSATAPHVGLSDVAKDVAARIEPAERIQNFNDLTATAIYTDKLGNKYQLQLDLHKETYKLDDASDNESTSVRGYVTYEPINQPAPTIAGRYMMGEPNDTLVFDGAAYSKYNGKAEEYVPAIIESIDVSPEYRGRGIATAMLEFARRESGNVAVLHSWNLTQSGEAFARMTKASESYKPNQGMVTAARRALRWKEAGKATGAGTPVGWGRATDIASGRTMSLAIVKRMYSFFARHEVDKKAPDFDNLSNPSKGRIMWDAWGGDAGFAWSKGIVERADRLEKHLLGQHDQSSHGKGGSSEPSAKPAKRNRKPTELELKAIKDYTGRAAALVNAKLRGVKAQVIYGMPDEQINDVKKNLDSFLNDSELEQPLELFRYTTTDAFGGEDKMTKLAGKILRDKGYLSTTSLKSDAKFGGDVTIKIRAPKGSKAAPISEYSVFGNEREVLFARNTQMKVADVSFSNRTLEWTVEVEVVV